VFHRVDDMFDLDGPRFFRLVWRLPAYSGVLAARVAEQQPQQGTSTPRDGTRPREVPLTALRAELPGLIETN
jgi:hypothetical protein